MATPTNHWKLGLFVVVGFVIGMGTLVALGARSLEKATVTYKSYFDESVQGLDVGSPVKFRGVTIGSCSVIGLAPDHRHVAVTLLLDVAQLNDLALNIVPERKARIAVPPELRVQLGSSGITGVKYVSLDFFKVEDSPVETLPFPVPENYIPSAQSTMKNLEDSVVHAVDRFPEVADQIVFLLGKVSRILDEFDSKHLPEKAGGAMTGVSRLMEEMQTLVVAVDAPGLSEQARATMTKVNDTLARTDALLDRIQGSQGILASAERTTTAVSDIAHDARGLGSDMEDTLREVRGAAVAIQRLGEELDRDPDMLLKGRSRAAR